MAPPAAAASVAAAAGSSAAVAATALTATAPSAFSALACRDRFLAHDSALDWEASKSVPPSIEFRHARHHHELDTVKSEAANTAGNVEGLHVVAGDQIFCVPV